MDNRIKQWTKKYFPNRHFYSYQNVCEIGLLFLLGGFLLFLILGPAEKEFMRQLYIFPFWFSLGALVLIVPLCLYGIAASLKLIQKEGYHKTKLMGFLLTAIYVIPVLLLLGISVVLFKAMGDKDCLFYQIIRIILVFLQGVACIFDCALFGITVMTYAAAKKIPEYDKDFIIIPGCSISRTGGLLPLLKGRATTAVRFAWDQERATGKPCLYVPSGGQGKDEVMSEGSAMELYLLSHGAEGYEVFPEKQSVNTEENFAFSKKIIDGMKPNAKVAFSTTDYHVFRCGICARHAGFDAEGVGAKTKWYFSTNGFIREIFALLYTHLPVHCLFIIGSLIFAVISVLLK